jgi:hypothetical protein
VTVEYLDLADYLAIAAEVTGLGVNTEFRRLWPSNLCSDN